MAGMLRVARLFFVLLAVVATGRWLLGTFGVPYEKGHQLFSIVILTAYACIFLGAASRRWMDYRLMQSALLGLIMGFASQVVILALTVTSYGMGLDTYFNHPTALNSPETLGFAKALVVRLGGLVGNSILGAIIGALGWALGGLLPRR